MNALITGASSGIGRDIAIELASRGYNVILVARRKERLVALRKKLRHEYGVKVAIIVADLSKPDECFRLHERVKTANIGILVNNAGFGIFGAFEDTDINEELGMIDLNIKAVHILTKLFLRDFTRQNHGYILNVASSAGFFSGPMLSGYYASKNYVLRLTEAINEELKSRKSNVYVGALCPGPVNTEFGERAGVMFAVSGLSSEFVAKYAVEQMFKRKMIVIPGSLMKAAIFAGRFIPERAALKIVHDIQNKKITEI